MSRWHRKYKPWTYYDPQTGWYATILIITTLWKLGPDPHHQPGYLYISFGPFHLGIARESLEMD